MFTGIVTDIGEVVAVEPRAEGLARLKIACSYDPDGIDIGASIACGGVCLTVVGRGRTPSPPSPGTSASTRVFDALCGAVDGEAVGRNRFIAPPRAKMAQ